MAREGKGLRLTPPGGAARGARLLFIRTDAIGDAVLAADQLQLAQAQIPGVTLAVACPEPVADLYRAAPFPLYVLAYDPERFRRAWAYRLETARRLRAFRPTHVLNCMVTRTFADDLLALFAGGGIRVAWGQMGRRRMRDQFLDIAYTCLLDPENGHELNRNASYVRQLGFDVTGFRPRIWMRAEDWAWANEKIESLGLNGKPFIVLFAGAQLHRRGYQGYGTALEVCFGRQEVPVVAVGAMGDRSDNQANLDAYSGPSFNLCGETSLPRLAALVAQARLAFGAETGVSHVACAVGVPQVVLLGGGHFGRFHPYSPLTTLASRPLDCFGCGWACRYSRAHCIHDVPPGLLAAALRDAWATPSPAIRIFHPVGLAALPGGPADVPQEGLPLLSMAVQWRAWTDGTQP